MTGAAAALLGGAGLVALLDWWAVATHRRGVEYLAKPLTLALLIAVAAAVDADDGTRQAWFLVALSLSLVGDVALMVPGDRFVEGLGAFLLAHVAYVIGMAVGGVDATALVVGIVITLAAVAVLGRRIVAEAPQPLRAPVAAYVLVISAMVAAAVGTTEPWIIAGGVLFYVSDALIGWTRFVADHRHGRLAVMVTYHLGQAGLVVGLAA